MLQYQYGTQADVYVSGVEEAQAYAHLGHERAMGGDTV